MKPSRFGGERNETDSTRHKEITVVVRILGKTTVISLRRSSLFHFFADRTGQFHKDTAFFLCYAQYQLDLTLQMALFCVSFW